MIDFQDAMRGPFIYDLVALLRDSYVEVPEPLLSELIERYRQRRTVGGEAGAFRRLFEVCALQRKLKDAGRFVYLDAERGNSSFLEHIPLSLQYVRETLAQLEGYHGLAELLAGLVPELRER